MTTITIERELLERALDALDKAKHGMQSSLCQLRFIEISSEIRAALAAPATAPEKCGHCERKPMTEEQITRLLDRIRMQWVSSPPTYEAAPAFVRAVEAHHGIGDKT